MNRDYHELRENYKQTDLKADDLAKNPLDQFKVWFDEAIDNKIKDSNAISLSTLDKNGDIHSRIVLIKEIRKEGFIFYTNYESHKAKQIESHPQVGVNIFWRDLERQIRLNATVEKISETDSDNYFSKRPRDSQLGAWTSHQSEKLQNKEELMQKFKVLEEKYKDKNIPRPDFWGGYIIKPYRYEFWQGAPSRLHDRFVYELVDQNWSMKRLSP